MKDMKKEKIWQFLKGLIAPVIICVLILIAVLFIINHKNASDTQEAVVPYSYEGGEDTVVLENDKLKLEMDPVTTQFTLTVKENCVVRGSISSFNLSFSMTTGSSPPS